MDVYRSVEEIAWIPHPTADGVQVKSLITKKEQGTDVTCMLVRIPVGDKVPEHVHADQDDILFILAGRGVMWVDGIGEFLLANSIVVRVPKGTPHRIENVTEDLLIYDVFSPYLL